MMEEFIIRIGANATAMKSELGRAGAYAKAWATTVAEDFKGKIGRMFAAGFVVEKTFEFFRELKNKILEISHLSETTGANTNFIQSMMLEASKSGVSIESLAKPLQHFNILIGQAKQGIPGAIIALRDMGVITEKNSARTLTYRLAMHNLALEFDKLHDKQKQMALLAGAFGEKGAANMFPVFEHGAEDVDAMSRGNFFTKINPQGIAGTKALLASFTQIGNVISSIFFNLITLPALAAKRWETLGKINKENPKASIVERWKLMKQVEESEEKIAFEKNLQAEADKEGITVAELKSKILLDQRKLLEQQHELQAQINDQGKASVSQMAAEARKLLGTPEPRNYGVSSRMRTALKIDTLEKRAQLAYERGNDSLHDSLWQQAQQLRARSSFLSDKDQNPLRKTESQLEIVTSQLEPVSAMAKAVNKEHGN